MLKLRLYPPTLGSITVTMESHNKILDTLVNIHITLCLENKITVKHWIASLEKLQIATNI